MMDGPRTSNPIRVLTIVMDDAGLTDTWSPVGGKVWNWYWQPSKAWLRRVRELRRHRQRCANLNLRYPLAHPTGSPTRPAGRPSLSGRRSPARGRSPDDPA